MEMATTLVFKQVSMISSSIGDPDKSMYTLVKQCIFTTHRISEVLLALARMEQTWQVSIQ